MTEVMITSVSAQVADRAAVNQMLEGAPLPEDICAGLDRPYFGRRWDSSGERSFRISSDGTTTTGLAVTGLNVDETIAIWIGYDDCRSRGEFELSAIALREIIGRELHVHAELEG